MNLMRNSAASNGQSRVGWAGWWLPMPHRWRILKATGNYRSGSLVVGDSESVKLELVWAWVSRVRFDPAKFLQRFLLRGMSAERRSEVLNGIESLDLPHFESAFGVRDEGGMRGTAYSELTHRVLHWVWHGRSDEANAMDAALSGWRDQPMMDRAGWQFFGVSFESPPGFRLQSFTLNLGDMEIVLNDPSRWGTRHRLTVRFIFPAELALARLPIATWLEELSRPRRAVYQLGRATETADGSLLCRGKVRLLLRTVFYMFCFRIPARAEMSLHHMKATNQLLYIEVCAPSHIMMDARKIVLQSCGKKPIDD